MDSRSRIRLGVVACLVLAMVPLTSTGPAAARGTAPAVKKDVAHDLSGPLRSIPPSVTARSGARQVPLLQPSPASTGTQEDTRVLDPVVQTSAPTAQMPSTTTSFDGIGATGMLPPDSNSDVGPDHIVEIVNAQYQVFDKSGASLLGPANIQTLWTGFGGTGCAATNNGDPVVLYDAAADRWVISQMSLPARPNPPFYQCLAVSQTGDPTGAWHRYEFDMGSSFNDYSKLGVWGDGYYMTDNEFDSSDNYLGAGVWAFERSEMLSGLSAQSLHFSLSSADVSSSLLPGDIDGPTAPPAGAPNPIVGFEDSAPFNHHVKVWDFHADWAVPANSTLTGPTDIAAASFDANLCGHSVNCIPQPDAAPGLDALSGFMMYRLAYRNFGAYQSLLMNFTVDAGGGTDRAGIRWTELRKSAGTWSIAQQGTYAPDSDNRWMGSVAQDQNGNIALGYSVSSATTYPSIRYAGRLANDPPGALSQAETTLQAGSGSQTSPSGRWGDYTSMQVDPSDDCTFWYTNQYYSSNSDRSWNTRIGSFKFPNCGAPSTTIVGTLTGGYRTAAVYALYHLRSEAVYEMTVAPNLSGEPVSVELWRLPTRSSLWRYRTTINGILSPGSTFTVTMPGKSWGKGKYRVRGSFAGNSSYLGSDAPWSYFAFTR